MSSGLSEHGCQFCDIVHGGFLGSKACLCLVDRVKLFDYGFESVMDDSFVDFKNGREDRYCANFTILWELTFRFGEGDGARFFEVFREAFVSD